MDQTSRLPPTNLKSYRCASLSKANKIGLQDPVFRPEFDQFFKKKNTKFPFAEHRKLSNSDVRIVSWTMDLPNESEGQNVFFQAKNTTNKKKNKTDHRI